VSTAAPSPAPLPRIWLFLLFAALAAVQRVDRMPLFDPDEGRNAEVAWEMKASGQWVVPQFHGLPYLDKPALYFDAVAASYALFGKSEAAARLPSLLFAAATLLATFLLGRALFDPATAGFATVVLATSPLFFGFARIVIFDVPLACVVVLSWWAAERGRQGAPWGHPLAWAFIGVAVLIKGPVGLLLGVIGHVAMALGQPAPRRLGGFFHPLHLALFALVIAPWVTAVELRRPGFLRYALLTETVERLTRPTFQRTGPVWYYAPVLLLGLLPWSFVALARVPAWLRARRGGLPAASERGLDFAAVVIVAFFSLSKSKLGGYVLPVLPLLALRIARSARRAGERPATWSVAPGLALVGLGVALLAAGAGDLALAPRLRQPADLEPALDALLWRSAP
jgi:4-amino-4-deoxy-L-arabinose transferase-like glycosyltransferase